MPRKKVNPVEEPEQVNDTELESQVTEDAVEGLEQPPADVPPEDVSPPTVDEEAPPSDQPPEDMDTPPAEPPAEGQDTGQDGEATVQVEPPPLEEPVDVPEEPSAMKPFWMEPSTPPSPPPAAEQPPDPEPTPPLPKSDRQNFYGLDFNALDRGLTAEERQEWNSIYASYRGRSALTGKIIGVDPLSISVRNRQTGALDRQTMYCAVVVPYRVRIVIPASEMWEDGQERPDFVLQNMVGASIDFVVIKVDRESGFAVASRRMAARTQRYFFSHRPALHREGARAKCRVLSVGPRRCLVECYGHDINLTQRDLRYTVIPDLRDAYHPGLHCQLRHPVGSRRQASIAGKYGGGVFCNLPDGTVCMCSYSYQHEDADFMVGDTVILAVQRYDTGKRQMYGKILSKW